MQGRRIKTDYTIVVIIGVSRKLAACKLPRNKVSYEGVNKQFYEGVNKQFMFCFYATIVLRCERARS